MKEDILKEALFYVYILHSKPADKIYIGYSVDPHRRLLSHNHPQNKGWTKRYQPWEIFYTETFESKSLALKREKQLKTAQGRRFIHEKLLKHS
ncbi:MAG TPA: GIY-YIG nuclease family protein [Bacteroidales bacterium]|nr:GIY-YIG nuclease family protein [Bacteroidales bacterium]